MEIIIGLLIAAIGLQWAGLIVASPGTLVTLGDLHSRPVLLSLFALLLTATLMARRVPGAFLWGIVASAIFTTTPDLDAEFPALAARQLGWLDVPLLCGHEMSIPGSLPRCIRLLVHWNTDLPQEAIQHIYVRDAVKLRPDLCKLPPVNWDELEAWIGEQMNPHG